LGSLARAKLPHKKHEKNSHAIFPEITGNSNFTGITNKEES
jgi:hypothetical protein